MKKSAQDLPKPLSETLAATLSHQSSGRAVLTMLVNRLLRPPFLKCFLSIFRNFFLLQYKAAVNPHRFTISRVDHPLDKKIPFNPEHAQTYMDFLPFFIRTQGFLLKYFRDSRDAVKDFIASLDSIYVKAASIYAKNYSTTDRPRYLKRFRFIVIHAFDPHLMCIPSLHIMVVIRVYTQFKEILKNLGQYERCAPQIDEAYKHALEITEAVLYIKQHSVNCISAAMYAMSCFDNLFPPEEAERFVHDLFANAPDITEDDVKNIRDHILNLYRQFVDEGKNSSSWEKPLLDFLARQPALRS